MTEAEKYRAVMDFIQQEQSRPRTSFLLSQSNAKIEAMLQRSERQQVMFDNYAQNGITWEELKAVYDEAYQRGKRDMVELRMTYFYASAAIAFHESYPGSSDDIFSFLKSIADWMDTEKSRDGIVEKALKRTGVDTGHADSAKQKPVNTKKDRKAVERMRKSGITARDLEDERSIGYQNGWATVFYLSACYAAVALTLHEQCGADAQQIESFLERIDELGYEEINRQDILNRCARETGLDVSGFAATELP